MSMCGKAAGRQQLGHGKFIAAVVLYAFASVAQCAPFEFVFTGWLDHRSGIYRSDAQQPTNFDALTAFTLTALFDTSSPNLVMMGFPPGFVAYAPSVANLTIGGNTYAMQSYSDTHPYGISVSIFDDTTPFNPGRYAAGFIQDPVADRAGMVADFLGAMLPFHASSLVSTEFTSYQGVGVQGGKCTSNCPGEPPGGQPTHDFTPIPLTLGGVDYLLALGNYEDQAADSDGGYVFTATLRAIPEPATPALFGIGLVALAWVVRRKNRTRRE